MGHVAGAESADRKLPRVAGRARQALSLKSELIRPQMTRPPYWGSPWFWEKYRRPRNTAHKPEDRCRRFRKAALAFRCRRDRAPRRHRQENRPRGFGI